MDELCFIQKQHNASCVLRVILRWGGGSPYQSAVPLRREAYGAGYPAVMNTGPELDGKMFPSSSG